jgi:hypothetical protein
MLEKVIARFYDYFIKFLFFDCYGKKFTNFPLYQILHNFTTKSQVIFVDEYGFKGSILYN